ncbi:MAG: PAS domain-containing protein, partial [Rhodomicrobium sp.]
MLDSMARRGKTRKKDAESADALDFKALVQGLPHIVLVVDGENRIIFANFAAEVFFGISEALLKKRALNSVLAYSNPLGALANQVRVTRGAVNEYEVDLGSPEIPYRAVDIFASLLAEDLDYVLVMVQ